MPAPSTLAETTTILFPVGSNELSADGAREVAETLAPFTGNPLVEVNFTAYFPYGQSSGSPGFDLAGSRVERLRQQSADAGISLDLIGGSISATGWTYEAGQYQDAPYPPSQLDRVEMTFRVKSECHPLVDLARQRDPYQNR